MILKTFSSIIGLGLVVLLTLSSCEKGGDDDSDDSTVCGDGICNKGVEDDYKSALNPSCDQDCPGTCGDGYCNTYYENQTNCHKDCPNEDSCEENDIENQECGVGWVFCNGNPWGCFSGVANDDDWYYVSSNYCAHEGTVSIESNDSSGEIDLCKGAPPVCTGKKGNKISFSVNPVIEDTSFEVKLISGSTVSYKFCWSFYIYCDGSCPCTCGNGICDYIAGCEGDLMSPDVLFCSEECGCFRAKCGDGYCNHYCGERYKNCPEDCR